MDQAPGEEKSTDLIETYHATIHPLYQFVSRRTGGSRQLAEDITQETYLRAVDQWRNGQRPENALAWLQTVARNLLLNHYRRRRPELLEPSTIEGIFDTGTGDHLDANACLYWGLSRLSRSSRDLLEAFYIDGESTRAIATKLGLSERAVEGRLRRARLALKACLKSFVSETGGTR